MENKMNLKVNVVESSSLNDSYECVVAFVTENPVLSISSTSMNNLLPGVVHGVLEAGNLLRKQDSSILLYDIEALAGKKLLLVYIESFELRSESVVETCNSVIKKLKELPLKHASICFDAISIESRNVRCLAEQITRSFYALSYQFTHYKQPSLDEVSLIELSLCIDDQNAQEDFKSGVKSGSSVGIGSNLARDLGNMPPNICHPSYLANIATELSTKYHNLSTAIVDESEMEQLGMNAFLSVGQGSAQPSKLVVMHYQNAPTSKQPIALVGKGVTFDSGGISIKPGAAMDEMKFDMCGAAAVFGVMRSVVEQQLSINLICVIAAAENMPSASATRPGDIVTSMSGKSIEILNTDAEGRLVLCDSLTYVQKYNPEVIIDVATLTGACVVALGEHATGLMSNDETLTQQLLESGQRTNDKAWPLPMWPEYTKKLESNFADLANIGSPGAGTITAACFLAEFVEGVSWAHLDIAGTAWLKGSSKGATGRPVALLFDYLSNRTV
jgi:leucyl aminopeptidase